MVTEISESGEKHKSGKAGMKKCRRVAAASRLIDPKSEEVND